MQGESTDEMVSVVATQGLGAAVVTQISGTPQFNQWFLYVLFVFIIVTLVVEIVYLNVCSFNPLSILLGAVTNCVIESVEYLQCRACHADLLCFLHQLYDYNQCCTISRF